MPVIPFQGIHPTIGKDTFIAPNAWLTGDVQTGADVSFFFGAVARGDINPIRIGQGTNLQEHALLHTSTGRSDCIIGDYVTVGHRAIIHGCLIGNAALIGMGATVLDDAEIGDQSMVGAQSLVPSNMKVPEGTLALGVPAKIIRDLTPAEIKENRESANHYIEVARAYRTHFATSAKSADND